MLGSPVALLTQLARRVGALLWGFSPGSDLCRELCTPWGHRDLDAVILGGMDEG